MYTHVYHKMQFTDNNLWRKHNNLSTIDRTQFTHTLQFILNKIFIIH